MSEQTTEQTERTAEQAQADELRLSAASYREEAARLEQAANELDPQGAGDDVVDEPAAEAPAESMYPHLENPVVTEDEPAGDA